MSTVALEQEAEAGATGDRAMLGAVDVSALKVGYTIDLNCGAVIKGA